MTHTIPDYFGAEAFEEPAGPDPDKVFRGQLRMAHRLADAYADSLMYVYGLGWHYYDGARWVEDQTGHAERCVMDILKAAHTEAFQDADLARDVRGCNSATGLRGVLELAAKLEVFAFTVNDLDSDPYMLNVANGTLDLRTMELTPHNAADRITKVCNAAWDPESRGPVWEAFLNTSLPDREVRAFLQRYTGQALVGRTLEHALAILTGTGRNGKGVWYGAVNKALGSYATSVRPDLLLSREGAHSTEELDLKGVRWVTMSEIEQGRTLAEATMKRLTGGDEIRARRMRQDSIAFMPSHTLAMIANHLPKTSGNDDAVWKRIRVVPFEVVIPKSDQDPHLNERLEAELDAILGWVVAGWEDYAKQGLADPAKVMRRTEAYRNDTDGVGQFLAEYCVVAGGCSVPIVDLWKAWERFANTTGFIRQASTQRELSKALQVRGFEQGKSGSTRKWKGIGLRAEDGSTLSAA